MKSQNTQVSYTIPTDFSWSYILFVFLFVFPPTNTRPPALSHTHCWYVCLLFSFYFLLYFGFIVIYLCFLLVWISFFLSFFLSRVNKALLIYKNITLKKKREYHDSFYCRCCKENYRTNTSDIFVILSFHLQFSLHFVCVCVIRFSHSFTSHLWSNIFILYINSNNYNLTCQNAYDDDHMLPSFFSIAIFTLLLLLLNVRVI